jgi:hypothetical protein
MKKRSEVPFETTSRLTLREVCGDDDGNNEVVGSGVETGDDDGDKEGVGSGIVAVEASSSKGVTPRNTANNAAINESKINITDASIVAYILKCLCLHQGSSGIAS